MTIELSSLLLGIVLYLLAQQAWKHLSNHPLKEKIVTRVNRFIEEVKYKRDIKKAL